DVDESGVLEHEEWLFHTPQAPQSRLFIMNADGTNLELLADVGLFDASYLGSPDWSPDGKTLVFDATPSQGLASDFSRSLIVTLVLDGPDKRHGRVARLRELPRLVAGRQEDRILRQRGQPGWRPGRSVDHECRRDGAQIHRPGTVEPALVPRRA